MRGLRRAAPARDLGSASIPDGPRRRASGALPGRRPHGRTAASEDVAPARRRGTDVLCVRFDGRDDGVVATHTRRDAPLWEEDVFEVFLAPGDDSPRLYYEFEVNPLGTLFDARVESPDLRRVDDARRRRRGSARDFRRSVTRGPRRWSASLRIPLAALCSGPAPADAGAPTSTGSTGRAKRRVLGVVADLRGSAGLPRAGAIRDAATSRTETSSRSPGS